MTRRPPAAASPLLTRRTTRRGGDGAGVLLYRKLSLKGAVMAQVPWLSQDKLEALQGVLAVLSVVMIARIIINV